MEGTDFLIRLYKKAGRLGEGTYGKVNRYTRLEDKASDYPNEVAVKKLRKSCELSVREEYISRAVSHPNIVRYFGVFNFETSSEEDEDERLIGLVMEVGIGSLDKMVGQAKRTLDVNEAKFLSKQMVAGVSYLHNQGIIHRDIKPDNLLLMSEDGSDKDLKSCHVSDLTLKIADFGHARNLDGSTSSSHTLTTRGTLMFMAPEVRRAMFEGQSSASYNKSADVWSMGMVTLYMVKCTVPSGVPDFGDLIRNDPKLQQSGLDSYLLEQLKMDKDARISSKELLKHSFLK